MAWRRPGDKPLSQPRMESLLTHICVSRPQWVNWVAVALRLRGESRTVSQERQPGPWFNINVQSFQYRRSHCGDKTIRSSYLHNGISITGKMALLYWANPKVTFPIVYHAISEFILHWSMILNIISFFFTVLGARSEGWTLGGVRDADSCVDDVNRWLWRTTYLQSNQGKHMTISPWPRTCFLSSALIGQGYTYSGDPL